MIESTIHGWSEAIGIARETLVNALVKGGNNLQPGEKIPARMVFDAITGNKEAAATRKLLAEAEAQERENRMENGEIVTVEQAAEIYGRLVSALVQDLDSIPAMLPGLTFEQRQILTALIEGCKSKGRKA